MLVNSLVFLESPTLKHIWIFYFYVCVELQLKCVENESYIFFRENVLAANKIWLNVKDFASDINLLKEDFCIIFLCSVRGEPYHDLCLHCFSP